MDDITCTTCRCLNSILSLSASQAVPGFRHLGGGVNKCNNGLQFTHLQEVMKSDEISQHFFFLDVLFSYLPIFIIKYLNEQEINHASDQKLDFITCHLYIIKITVRHYIYMYFKGG